MNDLEVAWLAGLFEGEGYTCVTSRSVYIGISMGDLDVLQRVHRITGVGTLLPKKVYAAHHTPMHTWRVANLPQVQEVVRAIYPHMGSRRRAKFDEVLARELKRPGKRKDELEEATIEPCANPACTRLVRRTAWHRRTYVSQSCSRPCRNARVAIEMKGRASK